MKAKVFLDSWVWASVFDVGSDTIGSLDDDCLLVHGKTVRGGASTLSSDGFMRKDV